MVISQRQFGLLAALIKEYVQLAKPVSSNALVGGENLDFSPATVRNDLMALEEAGYLHQPHTSAGRVPTEKAWLWYVQHELVTKEIPKRNRENLRQVVQSYRHVHDELMRHIAKTMAEIIRETVIVATTPTHTYYTGLAHLFAQPEFEESDLTLQVSRAIDHIDDVMANMFASIDDDVRVLVGKNNPFGEDCGAVVTTYHLPHQPHGVIGILGPMRQDYGEHVAMVKYAKELLKE